MHLVRQGRRAVTAAVVLVSTLLFGGTAAFAQYPGGTQSPTPPPPTPPTEVKGGKFPHTGADVLLYVVIAVVILLVGLALLRVSRSAAARDD